MGMNLILGKDSIENHLKYDDDGEANQEQIIIYFQLIRK